MTPTRCQSALFNASGAITKTCLRPSPLLRALVVQGALVALAQAAPVANWTERTGLTPVSNLATASPTIGDGSSNSADARSIWAVAPTAILANAGDKVTLSGTATLSGIVASGSQFRWGLYDVNGSGDDTAWLGYMGSQGSASGGAPLYERNKPNTVWYMSTAGGAATTITTSAAPNTNFTDGTYTFLLKLERTAGGMQIDSSIIRSSDSQQFGLVSFLDTTPETFTFNRVGFLIGNNLDADQVQFTNIGVSFLPASPDTTPPLLTGTSPPDDASGVPVNTTLVATFDEAVTAGTGNIILKKTVGNATVASFDVATPSQVNFSGANVSIDLPADLDPLTGYYVLIDATAIVDGSGNPFAGISTATTWNFTTIEPGASVNPGPRVFAVDFNRNDALGSPSQSLFRIVSGSTNQGANASSYTKTIGAHQVTISQPAATAFEFRGANTDGTRAIPGGDTSLSFLVSDFIATRGGALDIGITNLPAGDYVFRSYHLESFTGTSMGFAQGATTTTPNTIEARISGVLQASVQATALGSVGLNTTFINDAQIPTLTFAFSHDGLTPLSINLTATASNGPDSYLLLNGFELFLAVP